MIFFWLAGYAEFKNTLRYVVSYRIVRTFIADLRIPGILQYYGSKNVEDLLLAGLPIKANHF